MQHNETGYVLIDYSLDQFAIRRGIYFVVADHHSFGSPKKLDLPVYR